MEGCLTYIHTYIHTYYIHTYIHTLRAESESPTMATQVAEHAVAERGTDPLRLFFLGGSHSGFIGAHLAGQYPTSFAAYSLRNPV